MRPLPPQAQPRERTRDSRLISIRHKSKLVYTETSSLGRNRDPQSQLLQTTTEGFLLHVLPLASFNGRRAVRLRRYCARVYLD